MTASDGASYDRFGWSVAIRGDTVVVGAPEKHVFVYAGDRLWDEGARLITRNEISVGGCFGWPVSLSGDRSLFEACFSD